LSKNYHTDNKSFVVYKDWEDLIFRLDNDEQVGQLFKALFAFAKRGEETKLDGALDMAFAIMKSAIERDGQKWEKICSKNSDNINKRWNNAIQTNTTEYERIQVNTNYTDNVNVNDNDNVTVNVTVNVSDNVQLSETHGKHNNVKLSKDDYNELTNAYGKKVIDDYISRLDEYISAKNIKPYRNHKSTLVQWLGKDNVKTIAEQERDKPSFDLNQATDAHGNPINWGIL